MDTLDTIFNTIQTSLQDGVSVRQHPFRYCTLATVEGHTPRQRTVVLREVSKLLSLTFYSDLRAPKVQQLLENPETSILLYDPQQHIQLVIEGQSTIISEGAAYTDIRNALPERAYKEYTTQEIPGTPITTPDALQYNSDQVHFGLLQCIPHTITYLKINTPYHIRARFTKLDARWEGTFITP